MSFQRILVAIDCSPAAATVFEQTLKLAFTHESSVMLVHCLTSKTWEEFSLMMDSAFGLAAKEKLRQLQQKNWQEMEQARKLMQTYCAQATAHGIPTQYYCPVGEPSFRICEFAHNWCADLIIVGRRSRRGLLEILLGGVSDRVVRQAPCSVLIVQEPRVFSFQGNDSLLRRHDWRTARAFFFPSRRSPRLAGVR